MANFLTVEDSLQLDFGELSRVAAGSFNNLMLIFAYALFDPSMGLLTKS